MANLSVSPTFLTVQAIIAETCDIPPETITPESHIIDDLGLDSLDFLDIVFAIDKAFKIKLSLEQWSEKVNNGKATTEEYLILANLTHLVENHIKGIPEKESQPVRREIAMAFANMRSAHAAAQAQKTKPSRKGKRLPTMAERADKLQKKARREREKSTS